MGAAVGEDGALTRPPSVTLRHGSLAARTALHCTLFPDEGEASLAPMPVS
jgi:hypothetical protein